MKTTLIILCTLLSVFSYGQFHIGETSNEVITYFKDKGYDVSVDRTEDGTPYIKVLNKIGETDFFLDDNIVTGAIIFPENSIATVVMAADFDEKYAKTEDGKWMFITYGITFYIHTRFTDSGYTYFSIKQ